MGLTQLRDEEYLSFIVLIFLLFTGVNINPQVGMYYLGGFLAYFALLMARRRDWIIEIKRGNKSFFDAVPVAVAVLAAWGFLSTSILTHTAFVDFFARLYTEANVPALSSDPTAALILFGVVVPIVESFMFLNFVLIYAAKLIKVNVSWPRFGTESFWKMLMVCAVVGAVGSLFHITVRGMSEWALLVDFLFFTISAVLVFKYKQLLEPMWFHILTNSAVLILGAA